MRLGSGAWSRIAADVHALTSDGVDETFVTEDLDRLLNRAVRYPVFLLKRADGRDGSVWLEFPASDATTENSGELLINRLVAVVVDHVADCICAGQAILDRG